jgi:DNA-binding GntR family transcriptional regulator
MLKPSTPRGNFPIMYLSLADQIFEALKEQITSLQLKPGTRLMVGELAKTFGASHTPVKEALRKLAGEGLIEIFPHRGTFVSQLSRKEIRELLEIRLALELYAGISLINNGLNLPKNTNKLDTLIKKLTKALENNDNTKFALYDREFHLNMVKLTGNSRLSELHKSLTENPNMMRVYAYKFPERSRITIEEHEVILQELIKGDGNQLLKSIIGHLATVLNDLKAPESTEESTQNAVLPD